MLSPLHFPLQLLAAELLSLLDQGFRRDLTDEGLYVLHWEYLQVVEHHVWYL
jgi:hypothetical protein